MTTFEGIEKEQGFLYPALYRRLAADGMLDSGPKGPAWFSAVFPQVKENPPLLLFGKDVELLAPEEVAEALQGLYDPLDYRQINPDLKFIPFAQSGAGDYYCFFPSGSADEDVPVVFLWHDANEAKYLAKNLQDFMFRGLLEAVEDLYPDALIRAGDFKTNVRNTLKTHGKYLPDNQRQVVEMIFNREPVEYEVTYGKGRKETREGLLTYTELEALLAEHITFKELNTSFEYSNS